MALAACQPSLVPHHYDALVAGAAAVDLTPGLTGASLAGYGTPPRRDVDAHTLSLMVGASVGMCPQQNVDGGVTTFFRPSDGTRDAIRAQALVVANGDQKIAVVKLDTIGAAPNLRQDLLAAALAMGIPEQNLAVLGTHTHSGPGAIWDRTMWQLMGTDCFSRHVYNTVRNGALQALKEANDALTPARVGVGSTMVAGVTSNRRGRPGVVDPELQVMKLEDLQGAPIAALFNYAVHGTCFSEDNMHLSSEVMGEMERVVERGLGKGVAIFTNGAEGDVKPEKSGNDGIVEGGAVVGAAVLRLWGVISAVPGASVAGALVQVEMPEPASVNFNCPGASLGPIPVCDVFPSLAMGALLPPGWVSRTLPFQALRVGDTVLATIPGEPITELGWDIKRRGADQGFNHTWVVGLANEHAGYFATEAEYNRGAYEGALTLFGPRTGAAVVDGAAKAMETVGH